MARADTEESRQFKIITADARFEDLGTEFGVMIDDKGRIAVAVFAGKVKAEAKLADGRWTVPVSLGRGEAAVCEAAEFTRQVRSETISPRWRRNRKRRRRRSSDGWMPAGSCETAAICWRITISSQT